MNCKTDVKEAEYIDWDSITMTVNNSAYQESVKPLTHLSNMTELLVICILVIGLFIIVLLLVLWERDRIHEAGVLMAMGVSKKNIMLQHFLECVCIYILAFCLACSISIPLSGKIGNAIYTNLETASEEDADVVTQIYSENMIDMEKVSIHSEFQIGVQPVVVAISALAGFVLVVMSVSVAFFVIVRRKPKELLTIME